MQLSEEWMILLIELTTGSYNETQNHSNKATNCGKQNILSKIQVKSISLFILKEFFGMMPFVTDTRETGS